MNLVGKAGKVIPGAALFEGGLRILDTYQSAETQDAKAEGYGAAAGNMAGALAGAAARAAIGSVVPVLGTAIGGVVGGILGSMGGETLGAMLGKSWFGSDTEKPAAVLNAAPYNPSLIQGLPGAVNMGAVVRSLTSGPATGPQAMPAQSRTCTQRRAAENPAENRHLGAIANHRQRRRQRPCCTGPRATAAPAATHGTVRPATVEPQPV